MALSFILFCLVSFISCDDSEPQAPPEVPETTVTASGLQITTLLKPEDCTETATEGKKLSIHYVATLTESGEEFANTWTSKKPFKFTLGSKGIIPGLEEGIKGMCVGEKRKLVIPPKLAYGEAGVEDAIPPNATLTYVVDLMNMKQAKSKAPSAMERLESKAHAKIRHDTKAKFIGELQADGSRLIDHLEYDASEHGAIEL